MAGSEVPGIDATAGMNDPERRLPAVLGDQRVGTGEGSRRGVVLRALARWQGRADCRTDRRAQGDLVPGVIVRRDPHAVGVEHATPVAVHPGATRDAREPDDRPKRQGTIRHYREIEIARTKLPRQPPSLLYRRACLHLDDCIYMRVMRNYRTAPRTRGHGEVAIGVGMFQGGEQRRDENTSPMQQVLSTRMRCGAGHPARGARRTNQNTGPMIALPIRIPVSRIRCHHGIPTNGERRHVATSAAQGTTVEYQGN